VLLTWDLWGPRRRPPTLPLAPELAEIEWGFILLGLALATLVVPRIAGPASCIALGLAVLGDQTRLQPELVSLGLLMTVPSFGQGGVAVARWHLTTLWLWAGLHKALSLGWASGGALAIAGYLGAPSARLAVAWLVPIIEIGLGLASAVPRAWPVVRRAAVVVHLGILLTLSPLFGGWNHAVWPWNVSLAVAAFLLFTTGKVAPSGNWPAAAILAAYPALFYVGITDAYIAHNLYSTNDASAVVCDPNGHCGRAAFDTSDIDVPLPQEPRLFRQWFDKVCAPGSTIVITGPHTRLSHPPAQYLPHACPRRGPPRSDVG
jgi:hypothetical protein